MLLIFAGRQNLRNVEKAIVFSLVHNTVQFAVNLVQTSLSVEVLLGLIERAWGSDFVGVGFMAALVQG